MKSCSNKWVNLEEGTICLAEHYWAHFDANLCKGKGNGVYHWEGITYLLKWIVAALITNCDNKMNSCDIN